MEVYGITLGHDVHIGLQLPTVRQTEDVVQVDEEDWLGVSLIDFACRRYKGDNAFHGLGKVFQTGCRRSG